MRPPWRNSALIVKVRNISGELRSSPMTVPLRTFLSIAARVDEVRHDDREIALVVRHVEEADLVLAVTHRGRRDQVQAVGQLLGRGAADRVPLRLADPVALERRAPGGLELGEALSRTMVA
jgi:hypothetical protein